jgi:hypothetical protein
LFGIDDIYINDKTTGDPIASVDPTEVTLSDYIIGSEAGGEVTVTD